MLPECARGAPHRVISRVDLPAPLAPIRVTISPWLVHRHRRLWDDPAVFDPDRFAGRPNAYLTDDAFLPFSKGPRVCIGAGFALTEASVVLAALLRRYRLLPADGPPAMPIAVVSIRPDRPYTFRLIDR